MSEDIKIKLKASSILSIPFQNYENDFLFIVNGKEFKTSRLISELISPKICQIHSVDPTIESFTIKTHSKGDFSLFLKLVNFNNLVFPENELEFLSEVIEQLGNESIDIEIPNQTKTTKENVIQSLKQHEQNPIFYGEIISNEIDLISSNFFELSKTEEMQELSQSVIDRIISNPQLKLEDEDQLLSFINKLYKNDSNFCELYQYVNFSNVSLSAIQEFLSIFDINDMNNMTWKSVSKRLRNEIKLKKIESKRYIKNNFLFKIENDNKFNGIIQHLLTKSKGEIQNKIYITSSTLDDQLHSQYCALSFNDPEKYFASKNQPNQWICFDFKEHKVKITNYTIRTFGGKNNPKFWVIEGSVNGVDFTILDTQENCEYTKNSNSCHTFKIESEQAKNAFRYIRFRQTDKNWFKNDYLRINSFEIYGDFI